MLLSLSFARRLTRRLAAASLALALAACSPVFNWREVPVGAAGLVALLPCKPDRATRSIALASESVDVTMAGCNAGEATFAVAQVMADSRSQADAWLATWRAQMRDSWRGATLDETSAAVPRADNPPPGRRFSAHTDRARIDVLWFTQVQADGHVALYQATLLGAPSEPDAAATFFEGLRLP